MRIILVILTSVILGGCSTCEVTQSGTGNNITTSTQNGVTRVWVNGVELTGKGGSK